MRTTLPILDALQQNRNDIVYCTAIDHDKILNKEAIAWIPTTMQNPGLKVQQIFYLFVVDLCETGFDEVTAFLLLYLAPELLNRSGDDALAFILLVDLSHEYLIFPGHCVGFA